MYNKVMDVMTKNIQVIPPECSIQDAARKMKEFDIGSLPVCNRERILGMITDRDIVLRVAASESDFTKTMAKDAMTSPIVYCFEDQDVEEIARIMEVKKIRRLTVLNREKRLVGIVSLGDIAVKTGREDLGGEILEKVSTPLYAQS